MNYSGQVCKQEEATCDPSKHLDGEGDMNIKMFPLEIIL